MTQRESQRILDMHAETVRGRAQLFDQGPVTGAEVDAVFATLTTREAAKLLGTAYRHVARAMSQEGGF